MNIGDVTPSKYEKDRYTEQYTSMEYFRRADEHHYYDVQKELLADYYWDRNEYLKSLQRAYDMLHHHTPPTTTTPITGQMAEEISTLCLHII